MIVHFIGELPMTLRVPDTKIHSLSLESFALRYKYLDCLLWIFF